MLINPGPHGQATKDVRQKAPQVVLGPGDQGLTHEKHAAAGASDPGAIRRLERAAVHSAFVSDAPSLSKASGFRPVRGLVLPPPFSLILSLSKDEAG